MSTDPIRRAWQESVTETELPPLDEVRKGADRFYRHIRRRNLIEYVACVVVIAVFGWGAIFGADPLFRIGNALVVIGTFLIGWQLHRQASAEPPPEAASALPILAHQRAQFARQRDALSRIWLWYIGPMMPGLLLLTFREPIERGFGALEPRVWFSIAVVFAITAGVWWLNHRAARALGRAVAELDALLGEGT